ncbi:MAG TPA: tetratricopeptide repeat protein [Conexibacter sp.]|jgi:putative thioredoxin
MVFDVTEQDFQREVLERSKTIPVVVDFWAEWCGPCRQLGPVLERGVAAREGKIALAKLDVDRNPQISQVFQIQSIPAVKAFKDGRVASEFIGAQPPAQVERFLDGLVPSEAELLVIVGDEESLRRAVELEPNRVDALVPLARLLHERGDDDEALELLKRAPGDFGAAGLVARISLQRSGTPGLDDAFAALDAGDHEAGLDGLIGAIPQADGNRDEIRKVVVAVLDELGVEHPLARDARRRLAAALY